MLKKKIKTYVVRVVFYRILKYSYLLRYVACLGYKKRIILSIYNEWCHKVNCALSSGSFIIVNSGVEWGGVFGGLAFPIGGYVGWEWCRKYTENTQKSQKPHKIQGGAP